MVIPTRGFRVIREDPDDNKVIACAVEAGAEAIISGDSHLLQLGDFRGMMILSPREACLTLYDIPEAGCMRKVLERRKERNIKLLRSELDRIRRELVELGAERIIHFGSSARGAAGLNSDLDLVVVMESKYDFPARVGDLYKKIKPLIAVDLLIYTPGEFAEMKENSPFLRVVLREGKVLYEAER